MPHCLQQATAARRDCTPAWCPLTAAKPLCCAHRTLPSMTICADAAETSVMFDWECCLHPQVHLQAKD